MENILTLRFIVIRWRKERGVDRGGTEDTFAKYGYVRKRI